MSHDPESEIGALDGQHVTRVGVAIAFLCFVLVLADLALDRLRRCCRF
ncbi:MAG: hypothetical protein KGR26_11410 [Cyanobacteria bacterium REEB65]|nr:hypothetical protein [Cyanobacteria bacterium REEB65]